METLPIESQLTNDAPPSEASEDASGDTDDGYDPLFDDEPPAGDDPSHNIMGQPAVLFDSVALATPGQQYPPINNLGLPPNTRTTSVQKESGLLDPVSYADFSNDILMTASFDGQVTLWDRRASGMRGVGNLEANEKAPPWCISVRYCRFYSYFVVSC